MSKTKDEQINMLLTYMKDEIESKGCTPKTCQFNFNRGQEGFLAFKGKTELNDEEIDKLLKTCYSREYITHNCMGGGELYNLTTEGQGRAISVEAAKNYTKKPQQPMVNIGTIQGPTQIGNNNTQNIEGVFEYILTEIEKSEAPKKEKEEAKGLLQKALAHPITSSIIGAGVGALISRLNGGN